MGIEIKTGTVKREHFELRRSGAFTYVAIQGVHVASIHRARSVMVDGVLTSQHSPMMLGGEYLGDFPTRKAALEAIADCMNQPAMHANPFRVDSIGPQRVRARRYFPNLDEAARHVCATGVGVISKRHGKVYRAISAADQAEALQAIADELQDRAEAPERARRLAQQAVRGPGAQTGTSGP